MIILNESQIDFSFPEVHPDAKMACSLIRTLRIPDNGETYPLPPGLGAFPVRHVADYQDRVPPKWVEPSGSSFKVLSQPFGPRPTPSR